MNFQKTYILGRVAHTPELKQLDNGNKVATFSMATNRNWKDKDGKPQEEAEWHNLVAFGKTAEILAQYVQGGQMLFVEGRNKTRSWEDKTDGGKRYRTEVIVESFQFGPKAASRSGGVDSEENKSEVKTGGYTGPISDTTIDYDTNNVNIDDIPF